MIQKTLPAFSVQFIVLTGLRQQISLFLDRSRVLRTIEQMGAEFEEAAAFEKQMQGLYREQDKYFALRTGLYEDLKRQLIAGRNIFQDRRIPATRTGWGEGIRCVGKG